MLTREDKAQLRQYVALTGRDRGGQASRERLRSAARGSPKETMPGEGSWGYARAVAAWALVEREDREAIDVFLTREDAQQALADCLRDEPGWRGFLWIEEVELAGTTPSPN